MRLLAVLMAALVPAATIPLAAAPPPIRHVSTAGTVWINATALPSGSSLYNGDTLATAENGFAMITCPERGRVEVRQDSLVSMGRGEITLKGGVVGSDGTAVRLGDNLVQPSGRPGPRPWFVVADRDGRQVVASYTGDVLIARDGQEPLLVPEGFVAVPPDAPGDDDSSSGRSRQRGIPSGPGSDWTVFSLSSTASVAIIVALGATAAVSTMIGYTLGERSVSPSN